MVIVPTHPRQRGARRRSARAPRGPGARQPRSAHPLRHPERLSATPPTETLPQRRRDSRRGRARGIDGAQREARRRTAPTASSSSTALRQWNEHEGLWMGWERKRGKIEEFNRLLRGATDTSFAVHGRRPVDPAARALLHHARQRHAPAARRRARADRHHHASAESAVVRSRASAASPRATASCSRAISVTFTSAAGSLFARLYSGHTGVDPYTTAVSDTYQDLFGEGIFTGKGLYDVDAFMAALEDSVPENALLSHDLFEGLHARVALVSDVELVDDYPVERADARPAAASLDPRRLADSVLAVSVRAVAARPQAQHAAADRRAGRFSTTCAAAWSRRRCSRCSSPAGPCCPARRWFWTLAVLGVARVAAAAARRAAARPGPRRSQSLPGVLAQPARRRRDRAGAGRSSA